MQTRSKNRKEQIISVAMDLLQTHGFENFSYLDIANRLAITKASIHHHFPKKEDLGVALCQAIQDWHEVEFRKILLANISAQQKLDTYINANLRYACGKNKICPLSSLQVDIASLPTAMRPGLKALDEHELDFITQVLAQGRQQGEFNFAGETKGQAMVVVLACKAALQYSRVHGDDIFEQTMAQIMTLLGSTAMVQASLQQTG
ncbi:TetR/AcrR family transcriptional regulator [Thalassotalea euphylliae]|uniref:TetR/AcrR family transcriptional regulator n=1 Tax=Thalassotalea euphylliae TaxID=1655234 RepID=A0A3E0U2A2_9GAMM|nr:TetR/AcrR family transcriptional regulator [Thalassotalea euphylliae]REL30844.1 TetR/AcrR family transcriptional regulator [Thalassotalea euphylliae]